MQTFSASTDVVITPDQRKRLTEAALKRFKEQIDKVEFQTVNGALSKKTWDVVGGVDSFGVTDVDEFLQLWNGYVLGWLDAQA